MLFWSLRGLCKTNLGPPFKKETLSRLSSLQYFIQVPIKGPLLKGRNKYPNGKEALLYHKICEAINKLRYVTVVVALGVLFFGEISYHVCIRGHHSSICCPVVSNFDFTFSEGRLNIECRWCNLAVQHLTASAGESYSIQLREKKL